MLVIHDILDLFKRFKPKFVKQYAELGPNSVHANQEFHNEVKSGLFPSEEHTLGLSDEVIQKLYGDK